MLPPVSHALLPPSVHPPQGKGRTFEKGLRWARPQGPGSNRPAAKETPGPGSYARLHSYPTAGFMGTGRGFNHNSSVG